jgi:hypothetical protein
MIIRNIIKDIKKFPSKLDSHLGELLKENLSDENATRHVNKDSKTIMYKYPITIDNEKFIFIVEYIFKEYETFLDLKRAIGINYYIYKDDE